MPEDDIVFALPKIPKILDNEDFEQKQEIKKQQDDEINDEIDLNRLKNEINAGEIPREIEFYFGGQNYNFFLACSKLNLSKDNENFIDFLYSDIGSQILREKVLSIHTETGNIFFKHYNMNESIYDFLLRQQNETKKIIHATLTYKDSFLNFLTELYRKLTVEVLSSDNDSILEFSGLTDLCAEIGVRLGNAIFANHERARLEMKKQEEEISKKYDFF